MKDAYDLYTFPLYRPPSEAYSLIIQITLGCSHNNCIFCGMYKGKEFIIKPIEQIEKEMRIFREMYKRVDRIFLADGDALVVPTDKLVAVLKLVKELFPECERVSIYGTTIAVLKKTDEDLVKLKENGLGLIYLGVESGDDEALKFIKKGVNRKTIIEHCVRVMNADIQLSITLIAGILGQGRDNTMHAINSGKIISEISPDFVGVLTLRIYEDTGLYKMYVENKYDKLNQFETLEEIKLMLQSVDPEIMERDVVFRCNHASNAVPLKGILPRDRDRLIREIEAAIDSNNIKIRDYSFL